MMIYELLKIEPHRAKVEQILKKLGPDQNIGPTDLNSDRHGRGNVLNEK